MFQERSGGRGKPVKSANVGGLHVLLLLLLSPTETSERDIATCFRIVYLVTNYSLGYIFYFTRAYFLNQCKPTISD